MIAPIDIADVADEDDGLVDLEIDILDGEEEMLMEDAPKKPNQKEISTF
ncbi:hypothetical protein LDL59_07775 [Kaistella anthropi]|nr:hypothetical protein [Kaistella anthropi]